LTYESDGTEKLYAIDAADVANPRLIASNLNLQSIMWSPDDQYLAYSNWNSDNLTGTLQVEDANGSTPAVTISEKTNDPVFVTANAIVFPSEHDGGIGFNVAFVDQPGITTSPCPEQPASFNFDAAHPFSYGGHTWFSHLENDSFYACDVDTGVSLGPVSFGRSSDVEVGTGAIGILGNCAFPATTNLSCELDLLNLDSSATSTLATNVGWLGFSPDGQFIAYETDYVLHAPQGGNLHVARVDGTASPRAFGFTANAFSFSPDSSVLAWLETASAGTTLMIAGDSGFLPPVAVGPASSYQFSPDGSRIAYGGPHGLQVVDAHGLLVPVLLLDAAVTWSWLDDDHILVARNVNPVGPYAIQDGIYVVQVPRAAP
jgi:hypothetical protein